MFYHKPGMVYISQTLKLVFVPIPKNGSTTIRLLSNADFKQVFLTEVTQFDYLNYNWFSVVRDPLDRFVSSYLETRLRGYNNIFKDYVFQKKLENSLQECLAELENEIFDPHFYHQSTLLHFFDKGIQNKISLLKFSNLEDNLRVYLKDLSINIENIGRHKRYSVPEYNNYKSMIFRGFKLLNLLLVRLVGSSKLTASDRRELFLMFRSIGSRLSYIDLMPEKRDVFEVIESNLELKKRIKNIYRIDYELIESSCSITPQQIKTTI
jgi:hypothetical protein